MSIQERVGAIPTAQETAHQAAIRNVLATHSRGLDRNNAELLKCAYWPDAQVDYGSFKGSAHQFAELVGPALASMYELTQHLLGQSFIELAQCTANTETYVDARHLLRGASEELVFSGRYLDQLELRDGQWKIIHRQVVMDWCRRTAVVDERESESFAAFIKGNKGANHTSDSLNDDNRGERY
jgi:hypothetical protein